MKRERETERERERERDRERGGGGGAVGPAKKGSQNLILKLLEMLAISQFKARFRARNQF